MAIQNAIPLIKGDDTNFNEEQTFYIQINTDIDLTLGFSAEFILGTIIKHFDSIPETKRIYPVITHEESQTLDLGYMNGTLKIYDHEGRIRTVMSNIPFNVKGGQFVVQPDLNAEAVYNEPTGISLEVGTISNIDYNSLANKPAINGVTLYYDTTLDDIGAVSESGVDSRIEAATPQITETVIAEVSNSFATKDEVYDKNSMDILLGLKVNKAEYNAKVTEMSGDILDLKDDIDTLADEVDAKANASDVYTKSQVYTKTQVDNKVKEVADDISGINTQLAGKADASSVYTKSETDTKISNDLTTAIEPIAADLAQVALDISGIDNDISGIRTDMGTMASNISGIESKVADIESDISGIKTDISELESGLNSKASASDMYAAQADIANLLDDVSGINLALASKADSSTVIDLSGDVLDLMDEISGINTELNNKQDILTAGAGVEIESGIISNTTVDTSTGNVLINKLPVVTSIDENSTDTAIPTAKAVYDFGGGGGGSASTLNAVKTYTATDFGQYLATAQAIPFNTADTWKILLDITYKEEYATENYNTHAFFGTSSAITDVFNFFKERMGPKIYLTSGYSTSDIGTIDFGSDLTDNTRYLFKIEFDGYTYKAFMSLDKGLTFTQMGSTISSSTKVASSVPMWFFYTAFNSDRYGTKGTIHCENSRIYINGSVYLDFATAEAEGKLINHGCTAVQYDLLPSTDTLNSESTDKQIPTAKAVYDMLTVIETELSNI